MECVESWGVYVFFLKSHDCHNFIDNISSGLNNKILPFKTLVFVGFMLVDSNMMKYYDSLK